MKGQLEMNPVEMAIRASFDKGVMNLMLDKYMKHVGSISKADKNKLLAHAKWLSESGIYNTAQMGEDMIKRILTLPEKPSV